MMGMVSKYWVIIVTGYRIETNIFPPGPNHKGHSTSDLKNNETQNGKNNPEETNDESPCIHFLLMTVYVCTVQYLENHRLYCMQIKSQTGWLR